VIAFERVTLFGLTMVAGRKVEYGRINDTTLAEAREIFIRQALIEHQLGGQYPFLNHNQALVEGFQEMEERFRRRNILVDDEVLYGFYDARLGKVYDRFTLNRLLRSTKNDRFLRMSEEDICLSVPDAEELYRFPASIRSGEFELELSYLFAPGDPADGVTVRIPHTLLDHLNPQIFEWLVPGLLPDKLLLLCKRLPKQLRRRLVPLPDAVDRIMDGISLFSGSLYQELERVLLRTYQLRVQRSDWQVDTLPIHLRMRFVLVDEQGTTLAESRAFDELTQARQQSNQGLSAPATTDLPPKRIITAQDLDNIAARLPLTDGQGRVIGLYFPALEIDELRNTVFLHYVEDEQQSLAANRLGLQFLYGLKFSKEMSSVRKMCKNSLTSHSASWLSLGAKATAAVLRTELQAFLLDGVFATSGQLPTTAEFQENVVRIGTSGLLRIATELLDLVQQILQQRRRVHNTIIDWKNRAKANRSFQEARYQDYLSCLEQIVPQQFLHNLRPEHLKHKPRYLQALALRIERAEHAPLKDSKKAERLLKPLARLEQMAHFTNPSLPCQSCQQEYLELLEEFRVSIFAPELGTAQPISEQRLTLKWQEVENICRRVE
jgi:ATP-dependent helicase HrpA